MSKEVDRLRAKKKQIYEDLKSEQPNSTKDELTYDPETGEPLIDGYPLYSGLPNRKRDADLKIGAWLSAALEDPTTCQSMKDDINEWFECTPQVHSIPMQKPTGDKPMKDLGTDALIGVSDMVEHEDGSATFKIDTTPEATRLLVEMGLVSLLEKAIDENNKDYSLDPSLRRDSDEQETDD